MHVIGLGVKSVNERERVRIIEIIIILLDEVF